MPDDRWTPITTALTLLGLALGPTAHAAGTAAVAIHVGPVQGSDGQIGCQLFENAIGFPMSPEKAVKEVMVPIEQGKAICVFDALAPGSYAVAVLHDTNGNQRIDTNALGLPTEGYGVSNNRTRALSAPRWDDARFELQAGQRLRLDVRLRY